MATFTKFDGGGNLTADKQYVIYLYPNELSDRDETEDEVIFGPSGASHNGGLSDFCQQLVDSGTVGRYGIYVYTDEPNVSDDDLDDFYNSFQNWHQSQSFSNYIGTHLGISHSYGGGRTEGAYPGSPFTSAKVGVCGVNVDDWHNDEGHAYRNPIHESIHQFAHIGWYDEATGNDHQLGDIRTEQDGTKCATPMGSNYSQRSAGDCDTATTNFSCYTSTLNGCEMAAIHDSAQKAWGGN